ncbi:ABC transporter permease [endosymbiont GvMRE of Glomus versiforme]|uniref:ABC transporter permease n=1 Tax=endosymbiont GvMRE of Glomus versiforme TaxID=2039283 RepID=UPI001558F85D|nr:ABC transporter permease [endosymbiont GvMRE of Glomus versiforme]
MYNIGGTRSISVDSSYKPQLTKWKEMFPNYRDFLREFSGVNGERNRAPLFFPDVAKNFFTFNSNSAWKDIFATLWKLFMWGSMGFCVIFLLLFPSAYSLISQPGKNGEDKTVLNVASPIKRDDLVISKILSFFTYFVLVTLLTFVIPYSIYYLLIAPKIYWPAFITFVFLASLVFPLLYFLLFGAILIYLNSLSPILSGIFAFILFFSPFIWLVIKEKTSNPFGGNAKWVENLSKIGSNLLVIIPLALLIGGLFLFLYRKRFLEKDFN